MVYERNFIFYYLLVGTTGIILVFYGLKGLGIISYANYNPSITYNPYGVTTVDLGQMIINFTPAPYMSPYIIVFGIGMIGFLIMRCVLKHRGR